MAVVPTGWLPFFQIKRRNSMSIRFDLERMARVQDAHVRWWNGTLDRPLVRTTIHNAFPSVRRSPAPLLNQSSCADFSWSPEQIIDTLDEELSSQEYLGDAFPFVNFDAFGPGVLAAFCGAKLDNSSGGVWFWADEKRDISDIHIKYDPDNKWARRIKAICRAGVEKWEGSVIIGMPDLGGVMDVAATFRGSEDLLTDLYDAPDEVSRINREIQDAWYAAYSDISQVLKSQPAHSDWSALLSREPSYIIQCDFCYMIGNPMFRKFVLDTLVEDTKRLAHTIYHLDGVGELNHLDDILNIKDLNAEQWVAGAGKPSPIHWLDVYKKIHAAGKQIMLTGGANDLLEILDALRCTPYSNFELRNSERDFAAKVLAAR